MATEKQIAANRSNAQHSTGPRSEDGKAASSRNNLRHGLTAKGLIVLEGQQDAFNQLEADLRVSLVPDGTLQEILFMRVLECSWNLERCRQATAALHSNSGFPTVDPLLDDENCPRYLRIQKYARENENSLYKAMRELSKLQEERLYRSEAFPLTQAQCENEAEFANSPHSVSEVCSVARIVKVLKRETQVEAKTGHLNMDTELKALAGLPPSEYMRRFEPNSAQVAHAAA